MTLTDYIRAAMQRAHFELMEDDEGFYGSIPGCRGVWANEPTLEACRDELQSVLEDWIFIKLRHADDDFTAYDGHDLNAPPPYVDPVDLPEPAAAGAA